MAHLKPGWDRDRIMNEIVAAGVPCFSGSCSEVYREKAFDGTGWRPVTPLLTAQELGETGLMFLVHPTLEGGYLDKTVAVLEEVMRLASASSLGTPSSSSVRKRLE